MAYDVNSLNNNYSRYVHGGQSENTEDFIEWWQKNIFPSSATDIDYTVEAVYEGRIDLISYAFYGDRRYWWVLAQYNAILDPVTEIVEGKFLKIRSPDRLKTEFLVGRRGGNASQRTQKNRIERIIR